MKNQNWKDKIKNLGNDNKASSSEKVKFITNEEEGEIFLIDPKKPKTILKKFDKNVAPDEIDMPNEFIDILIGKKIGKNESKESLLDMPIAATNILFRSIALVKSSQFSAKSRPLQLELFEELYKTQHNSKVSVVINIKDIAFSKTQSGAIKGKRQKVREAIDFLQDNLFVWKTGKNAEGQETDTKLSYIESPSFTAGKVYFEMNVYWLEQIMNLKIYNSVLFQLPSLLGNTRHILFSVYLERFKLNEWKQWNFNVINELFQLNYPDANSLAKGFLRELRFKLDKNSLRSFQYKVEGDYIWIMPYTMKSIVNGTNVNLKKGTLEKLESNYFANYLSRRHQLSNEKKLSILDIARHSESDKLILQNAYNELKKECRRLKVSITSLVGETFINKFNTYILNEYNKSERAKKFPNGFPRV